MIGGAWMPESVLGIFAGLDGRVDGVAGLSLDDRALDWANTVFAQLARGAGIGIWVLDLETDELQWSSQTFAIHGLDPALGINRERARACYAAPDHIKLIEAVDRALAGEPLRYEATVLPPDGSVPRRIKCFGERIPTVTHGDVMMGFMQDITDTYESTRRLQHAACHDPLTGLLNRRGFDERLSEIFAPDAPGQDGFYLFLMDLDKFKDINDTHGHVVGDRYLQEVATILREEFGPHAPVARWGGDEFAILMPISVAQAYDRQRLLQRFRGLEPPKLIERRNFAIRATCGYAVSDGITEPAEFVRRADLALCDAKQRVPGGIIAYDPALDQALNARLDNLATVRSALAQHRMLAAYQPIVELESSRIVGVEALIRLYKTDGTILPAGTFLSALDDSVVSWGILKAVLESLRSDFQLLRDALPELAFISINATQADLIRPDVTDLLIDRCRDAGVDPSFITIEITETTLHSGDADQIARALRQLHAAGFGIALDDFGVGYSSLAHLRDLPIDKVKVDGSFTRRLASDRSSRAIVMGTVAMARAIGIEVVGEGIEDSEAKDLLATFGCRFGQGYLFSPAAEPHQLSLLGRAARRIVA